MNNFLAGEVSFFRSTKHLYIITLSNEELSKVKGQDSKYWSEIHIQMNLTKKSPPNYCDTILEIIVEVFKIDTLCILNESLPDKYYFMDLQHVRCNYANWQFQIDDMSDKTARVFSISSLIVHTSELATAVTVDWATKITHGRKLLEGLDSRFTVLVSTLPVHVH